MRVFQYGSWLLLTLVMSTAVSADPPADRELVATSESPTANTQEEQSDSHTDDSDRVEGKDGSWAEFRTVLVSVVDEEGEPVVGAALSPYAMRMKEEDGHGFWNHELLGSPSNHVTDEMGQTAIRFPRKMHSFHKMLTTRLVSYSVQHPLFVSQNIHLDLGKDLDLAETEVAMVEGAELRVSAIGLDGSPLEEFAVLMAGRSAPSYWSEEVQGNKLTRSIQDGTWQTMIVQASDDDRHLFSDCVALNFRKGKALNLRKMPLTPGAVFQGTLSRNVPRPVKNGFAILVSIPLPAQNSWDEKEPSLEWHDWTEVTPDGNFQFESIPRSGEAQLIVSCDGWLSKTTIEDAGSFVMGQLFDVDAELTEATIDMIESGTLELTVLKPDGTPLDGGMISSWPNQRYYKGGSTILGTRYRSARMLKMQSVPLSERPSLGALYRNEVIREGFEFLEQEVKQGKCKLRGFPVGVHEQMVLAHPEFKLISNAGRSEQVRFKVGSAAPEQMVLKTVSRQTPDWMAKAQEVIQKAVDLVD